MWDPTSKRLRVTYVWAGAKIKQIITAHAHVTFATFGKPKYHQLERKTHFKGLQFGRRSIIWYWSWFPIIKLSRLDHRPIHHVCRNVVNSFS